MNTHQRKLKTIEPGPSGPGFVVLGDR